MCFLLVDDDNCASCKLAIMLAAILGACIPDYKKVSSSICMQIFRIVIIVLGFIFIIVYSASRVTE